MGLRLEGQRALVTGASGGLGGAIARALHARGAAVVVSGRREEALEALRAALGERIEPVVADLADPGGPERVVERAGRVDVLVANAGLPASGRLEGYSREELDRAVAVNLRAPMQLARALAPGMAARGHGHLVFMSSLNGKVASVGTAVYSATKFGLRGFSLALREDLRGTGVGVTSVFPSFVSEAGLWADTGLDLPPGVALRSPEDVAAAVVEGIEHDRAEVDVAPLALRAAGWLAGPAPGLVAAIGRRLGAEGIADRAAAAQRGKR